MASPNCLSSIELWYINYLEMESLTIEDETVAHHMLEGF